ncbi:MAG: 7-cyano-7-deazaguanine synthase QueC [Candidatus Eisenbacteria bacterium]|uniref:7-cyano-7-deazaguanine synthase n=1 Tax=Eiseniibacteriota bacterium TaxID=2212470 RepID=A0A948RXG3_UNCEI|nr:7-cyano-7-deazaguanine synthase QueC [Candidatus Eisenbacteria bacterium]MBU1947455.1 7-cyano-7-deazaguanine synthase QueC [Candidatus Eisenbacteria bacterium]MBU2690852.1 7-cyano-7-deazaguanine synthase QueC [Candidatus Eisenbacteria bacterium]
MRANKNAVVLLSGGLDSTTVLAMAVAEGWRCHALTINYGQIHEHELTAARRVAESLGATEHRLLDVDLHSWGGSSLVGDGAVPQNRDLEAASDEIPSTYVPARNTIFLSLALAWAEVLDAGAIFLGINALDYSGYPDCRPGFLHAFEEVARQGTRQGVEGRPPALRAPLANKTKSEIIRWGMSLGVDYSLTHTCYEPLSGGRPCRRCDSCLLREKGFREAGCPDPLLENGGMGKGESL